VLATGASVSDVIEIIVYDVFSVGNFFNRTDSDSRYVNVDGTTAVTITTDDNTTQLTLKSTDADGSSGPLLDLTRDSGSPADGDVTGIIRFRADNDAGEVTTTGQIVSLLNDASDGTEDGEIKIETTVAGSAQPRIDILPSETVFNEGSIDVDFRIESNGNANMLVVDGGNDVMAIGKAVSTSATLAIQNKADDSTNALDIFNDNGNRNISMQQDSSGNGKFMVINNAGNNMHRFDADGAIYRIGNESPATNGHIRMSDSGGYTMDWMGTGTRTYVFRGSTSGGNYTTTFDNPGGGVHNLTIDGALSKGSGSFKIDHPLESKRDTNWLVHSFLEGPQADLIYRGSVKLSSGSATVDIDTASGMTSGTFEALCTNVQCFTSNETGWTAIKGSVSGKTLTITAQDNSCTDTISWMVVGERNDTHMKKANWTDADGRVIVEPTRDAPPKEETPKEGRE
jgi:hypothetical protein